MARTAKYVKLDSKTARLKLPPRKEPYYTQIETGLCLGYARREAGPGAWVRRELVAGTYRYATLGAADDLGAADSRDMLTFDQARKAAGAAVVPTGAKVSVARALDAYLAAHAAKSTHGKETKQRADKWIRPPLGAVRVDRITKAQLELWLAGMVREDTEDEPDARRKSQDSANRVLTILKAALNHAFVDDANGIPSDTAWRRVKAFRAVGGAREDHFDATQVRTLIAKAATFDKPFATLLEVGYLTGARMGELAALDVRDLDAGRHTLHIRTGKTGARVVTLTNEAARFLSRVAGKRAPIVPLLPRADGDRWGKSEHSRPFKRAAALAELPATASFYALRHSHISRAIEGGMSLSLVAENCGTSLLMIQKNYAKVLASTRRDSIEQTGPKLRRVK
jgi:integrase